jgi:ubiquinone/menaquinone biosynthesis C-methylase UbiE
MRRVVEPELLDSDAGTPKEIAQSLGDLRAINRRFGGIRTLRTLVERVAEASGARQLTLLDIGAGSGDVPLGAAARVAARGTAVSVTLCDRAATHLPRGGARCVVGDALVLPFRDASYDLVSCSLFLHHLEPAEIARFVPEAMRVARRALVINDLRRGWIHHFVVRLAAALFKSRITRHDARVSVRRSYTPGEVRAMLRSAGVQRVELRRRYFFRMAVVAWKALPEATGLPVGTEAAGPSQPTQGHSG